jgi:hypothetical protein
MEISKKKIFMRSQQALGDASHPLIAAIDCSLHSTLQQAQYIRRNQKLAGHYHVNQQLQAILECGSPCMKPRDAVS